MSTGTPYIGSKISLISKAKIRYEGYLYTIDTDESTVTLAKVQSLGTEDRLVDKKVPARDEIYEYIVFRGTDIDDLHVCEGPKQRSQVPQDPAIVQTGTTSQPGMYPQMQSQMTPQFPQNYNAFGGMAPSFSYPFSFRPQPGMPVAGHPHSSSIPPMTNFGHKEPEKTFARTPSPPSQNAAPGSGLPFRDARDSQPADRIDRQKGERKPHERGEATQGEKRKEDRVRGGDREKGSLKDKDRDRERERDKDNRRNRDNERDLKRDRNTARERDNAKDRDAVREQDYRKERDGTRDRDARRDRRKEHGKETDDRKEVNRGFDQKVSKEREEDRNQKERPKDQDFDREERSRRGSGSGSRGRRSTKQGSNRGSSRSGPNAKPKFEEDFDFETANAKFNKEEVERELLSALKKNLTVRDEDEDVIVESESGKASLDEDKDEDDQDGLPSPAKYYDPAKSFYDTISCESKESDGGNSNRSNLRRQERERNAETFGPPPRGYRGRGRPFRGRGSRGGRSRGYGRARGSSYGGHYARHSGNRGWVDYDFNFKDAGIEKPSVLGGQS